MVNTCVNSHASFTEFTLYSLINPICFGVLLVIRLYVFYVEVLTSPPNINSSSARPQYGIGALLFLKMFLGLGMANSFASIVLFFFFYGEGSSGLEIACQSQAGVTGIIIPIFFISASIAVLVTNKLRASWTRDVFAQTADEAGAWKPASIEGSHVSVVFLGAGRGTFIPPAVKAIKTANSDASRIDISATDAFNTKYNNESATWIKANLTVEGVLPRSGQSGAANCHVEIKKIVYGVKFDYPDDSVDVVVLPTGIVLAYVSEASNEPEKYTQRMMYFMNEIHRILKVNGKFITSNILFVLARFEKAVDASKFGMNDPIYFGMSGTDIPKPTVKNYVTLSKLLWWSYIPAKMTIVTKVKTAADIAVPVVDANKLETVSPLASSSTTANTNGEPTEEVIDASEFHNEDEDKILAWFPAGNHWRLVEFLIVFTLGMWIGYVIIIWQCLVYLELPYFLPYDQQIAALFISNANILPFVIYLILARLRSAAQTAEFQVRSQMGRLDNAPAVDRQSRFSQADVSNENISWVIIKKILKVYKGEMFDVALLLTLNSGLGWFPYFILDTILIKGFNVVDSKVTIVNTIVSITVTILFLRFAGAIAAWYSKVKSRQAAQQETETASDARQTLLEQEGWRHNPSQGGVSSRPSALVGVSGEAPGIISSQLSENNIEL